MGLAELPLFDLPTRTHNQLQNSGRSGSALCFCWLGKKDQCETAGKQNQADNQKRITVSHDEGLGLHFSVQDRQRGAVRSSGIKSLAEEHRLQGMNPGENDRGQVGHGFSNAD